MYGSTIKGDVIKKSDYILVYGQYLFLLFLFLLLFTQEGASIMTGLTYNGKDKNGRSKWDGLANAWPV